MKFLSAVLTNLIVWRSLKNPSAALGRLGRQNEGGLPDDKSEEASTTPMASLLTLSLHP
jgi:hypothetical protein